MAELFCMRGREVEEKEEEVVVTWRQICFV